MAFTGPNVSHRTLRKEAVSKGTAASGLVSGDDKFSPQAGAPLADKGVNDKYVDHAAEASRPTDQAAQPRMTKNPTKVG